MPNDYSVPAPAYIDFRRCGVDSAGSSPDFNLSGLSASYTYPTASTCIIGVISANADALARLALLPQATEAQFRAGA